MPNNQDSGYVKVEDTLPGQQSAKGQQDVSWPMESQRKAMRTLGSFSNPQSKEQTNIPEPVQRQSKESPSVQAPIPQSKQETLTDSAPLPLSKDSASVIIPTHESKDSPDVVAPSDPQQKQGLQVEDRVTNARKDSPTVAETEPRSKSRQTVSAPSSHVSKSPDEVSPEPTPLVSKDSDVVNINGVYRDKDGNPVAVFKDHLKKSEGVVGMDDDHQKKKSAEIKPNSDQEKKESPINTSVPHGRKNAINIDTSAAAWSKKEIGEDIGSEIVGEPDQYKGEIVPELNGQSISQIDKSSKTEVATGTTTPQSKEELELAKLSSHGEKSEAEIDANKKHLEKKQYSYDELLAMYIKQVEDEQIKKKSVPQYSIAIDNKQNRVFNEDSHVDFTKVPQLSKSAPATEDYSTSLGNDSGKTFNEVLPTSIPTHTKSPKAYPEGTAENDIPSIEGFDIKNPDGSVKPVGVDKFVVSMPDRENVKTGDDVSDNEITVEGVESTAITATAELFDDRNYFKRTSGKIADRGAEINTYDSNDPKALSTDAEDIAYSEVRNSPDSEYRPVYDWTDLIPPRIGLASILKTATQTFGLSKYLAFPQMKPVFGEPVLGMDWLRFGQRALTGEVARYVFSRLQSSVLYGFNADKTKQRLERPSELSASGILDEADKMFNLLNPVVNFITANPADLFADKQELEFRGIIGNMGPQIDRSASGMFFSMEDYYRALRKTISARASGQSDKVKQAEIELEALEAHAKAESSQPGYDQRRTVERRGPDGEVRTVTVPSKKYWDDLAISRKKAERDRLAARFDQLKQQYATVLTQMDDPSEYTKYLDTIDGKANLKKGSNSWTVAINRDPKVGSNINPDDTINWRSANLNQKPTSLDDFDEETGYLFNNDIGVIEAIKTKIKDSFKEIPGYTDAQINEIAESALKFQYLLTSYGSSFGGAISGELYDYYGKTNKKIKDSSVATEFFHNIPSKSMNVVYAQSLNPSNTEYSYSMMGSDGEPLSSPDNRLPYFDDPHLTALFETVKIKPFNLREDFYKNINSRDGDLSTFKDQAYMLKLLENGSRGEEGWNYVNLSSINFDANKAYFSRVVQDTESIKKDEVDKDVLTRNRSVLYQASLNYLAGKQTGSNRRAIRDNILSIIANKSDTDLPFGSNIEKDSKLFVFDWFTDKNNTAKSDRNASILDILPDVASLLNNKSNVSAYADYNSSSKKIIDGLYQRRMAIVPPEFTNDPDVAIKNQVDRIITRNIKKQIIPVGMSMVSSVDSDNIKAVVVEVADPNDANAPKMLETKYVAQSATGVNDRTESITESSNTRAFTFKSISNTASPDGYSLQRNADDGTYYKSVKTKRETLDKQNPWNMTLYVSRENLGTVPVRETNLGGILVSASSAMDKVKEGTGNLYFEIPFQFNPEVSGESRSANWNSVTAFGRTHEHFIYSNTGARSVQFKTTYAITDSKNGEMFDKFGAAVSDGSVERNDMMDWAKGWTEDYILMIINMYRSLVLPINAYSAVTPPVITIDFGKMLGNYTRINTAFTNARWIVSEYSIDPNLDAGYTKTRTPRLFDVTLSLKEVYNGWHDAQDFYVINKHLKEWADGGSTLKESWQSS